MREKLKDGAKKLVGNKGSRKKGRRLFHRRSETIRGHVFCSFLAALLLKELFGRLQQRGSTVEWDRLRQDLDGFDEVTIHTAGKTLVVRSQMVGDVGKAIQAAGVKLGPVLRIQEPAHAT